MTEAERNNKEERNKMALRTEYITKEGNKKVNKKKRFLLSATAYTIQKIIASYYSDFAQ